MLPLILGRWSNFWLCIFSKWAETTTLILYLYQVLRWNGWSLILQFVDILMIWSLIYNNPEIGLRVVLRDIGSADTLSVLMNTLMQYTLSTWSLLFGMNGSSCGLWHRHFAWTQITLVLIGKGMLLDGSTLKTRTTLDEYCNRFILCMWISMSKYVYIYIFIYLFVHVCTLVTGVSSGPLAAV